MEHKMKQRQKNFYRLEWLTLILLILLIISLAPPFMFLEAGKFKWWILIIPSSSILFYVMYYRYLKSIGFEKANLEPNIYKLSRINYKMIIKSINSYLKTEMIDICDDEDVKGSYVLSRTHGLKLRILVMKINSINREIFKSTKDRLNRKINRKEKPDEWVSGSEARLMVRVNLILIDKFNEFSEKLVNENADYLMGRVEGIVNIIYCEEDSNLYIPTHFGFSSLGKHNKVHKLILNCLKDYTCN